MFAPVFAVLLALSESPSPPPPPTPTPEREVKQEQGTAKAPESKPSEHPTLGPSEHGKSAKRKSYNAGNKSPTNWPLVFAGVIAFGALVQMIAVVVQGFITRAQLRATQTSADATLQNAQNTRVLNRAEVVVEVLRFVDVGDNKTAFYKVRNIGKTSAYVYERIDMVQMIDNPLPDGPPNLKGIAPTNETSHLTPDPDDVHKRQFGGAMFAKTDLDTAKFAGEQSEIYAFGVIKYRDDFGSERTTSYAWKYRRNGPATLVTQAGYNLRT